MKTSKIIRLIEESAPLNLAENWDNSGLQLGSIAGDVGRVLLTLDVTDKTVEEAIDKKADLIISHHPFFFGKLNRIDLDNYKGKLIEKLIKNDIGVYSAHTNLDKAEKGINETIAKLLELKNIRPLIPDKINSRFLKLVIYVPEDSLEAVRETLKKFETGKVYDNYRNCTFRTGGTGTFEPINNANPTIGELDKIEEVSEIKIETIIPENEAGKILTELKRVHPYEEMAYDLFPVEIRDFKIKEGLGRIGRLKEPLDATDFIVFVKERLDLAYLREAGKRPELVRKVALCTGAGSEFIQAAKNKGADVLITGDLKYHDGQRAYESGIWVLDAGHFGTEKQVVDVFEKILEPVQNDVDVIKSDSIQDYIVLV